MSNRIKCLVSIFFMILLIMFCKETYAASANLTLSSDSVTVGDTITISVTGNAASWQLSLTGEVSGTMSDATASGENENVTMGTYTYNATKEGTISFSLSGKVVNSDYSSQEVSSTKSITVKAVEQDVESTPETTTPDTTTDSEPEQPTTTTVTEPTFTNANKTMYATGDINLRASWSTDSAAIRIAKGTELTVIGTSTQTVNGYVWYRVSYEGKTRYVASSLLTSEKPEEDEEEKANANLKSLTIDGFSISPSFSKDTLEYSMQVEMDIEKLDITAETENEKATVKIEGNETLAEGENTVKVIVTAEDGITNKTYIIKVTKQEEIFGLQSLIIKDTDIADTFKTDVYEYEINIKNLDMLDIEAIATKEDATIEILGNENLQEGENIITIMVKSEDETQIVTYQIKVNKLLVTDEPEEKTIDTKYIIFGVVGVILVIALVGVVIYTIKHRKEEIYTDDFDYYPEDLPEKEDDEYYAEDLPEKKIEKNNYYEEENDEEYEENEQISQDDSKNNKSNYFLEDPEEWEEYKKKSKRGKHF